MYGSAGSEPRVLFVKGAESAIEHGFTKTTVEDMNKIKMTHVAN